MASATHPSSKEGTYGRHFTPQLLTGAVAVAGIAATAGLAGCAPQQTSEATAGSSAQAAPAGSGKTTIGQTPAWLGDAPQIEESDIVNTMETELLIVGAGNAGMAAAVLATDLGIDFVVARRPGPWAQRATGTAR